jgi:hypothetical protein
MRDPLSLSLWLRAYSPIALPVYLNKMLDVFPVSRLRPGATLRVYAFGFQEAPLVEEIIEGEIDRQALVRRAQEFLHEDCAFQVETFWDLYQWDGSWELKPAPVSLETYAPEFDSPCGEHARVDFGPQALYLPVEQSDQLRPVQSNIRSLLRLAHDLEEALSIERRLLWSDDEDNFGERLSAILD